MGNSCSSITATAGAATCLQTITEAATASAYSLFVRRITGTGTLTIQQGATTLDVTASINSSTFTRVELDASVLNPVIGFIIGTNGDKFAIDMNQFENTAGKATSPIPTTTIAVARNADVLTYSPTGNINPLAITFFAQVTALGPYVASGQRVISINDGTLNNRNADYSIGASGTNPFFLGNNGGVSQFGISAGATFTTGVTFNAAGVAGTNNANAFVNGVAGTQDTVVSPPSSPTSIDVACQIGTAQLSGCIKNLKIWQRLLTNAQVAGLQ